MTSHPDAESEAESRPIEAPRRPWELRAPQSALAALVAWSITVAPAAFARDGSLYAKLLAALAALAGVTGPLLVPRGRRLARHVGISAFAALSAATWVLASAALHPARLDPARGAIGAVAWGVFALSWSDPWSVGRAPQADTEAAPLAARAALPRSAVAIVTVGVGMGLALLVTAWRVRDPDRALLAQTLAEACAIGVIGASAVVATLRDKGRARGSRRLGSTAAQALVLLLAVAVGGAVIIALR